MKITDPKRSFVVRAGVAVGAFAALLVVLAQACKPGGNEGDACNPLVLRAEENCNAGLFCKAATCSTSYCCPTDRASSEPNCNAAGCPDADAAADLDAGPPDAAPSDAEAGT